MKFRIEPADGEEEIVARVHSPSELTDRIESLVRESEGQTSVTVTDEDRKTILNLDFEEIECISVIEGKTSVTSSDGKTYYSKLRLYEIGELLPSYFLRINKSALANRKRIAEFRVTFGGGVNAVFMSGAAEYVSRRCFSEIKRNIL